MTHVAGHVLAPLAVAAGGAPRQHAVVVGERDAEAVDLEFRHIAHRRFADAEAFADPFVERTQLVIGVGVVEAQHRLGVLVVSGAPS